MPSAALDAFADEVGSTGTVVAIGAGTRFAVGGEVDTGARRVRAPVGVVDYAPEEMTVRVGAGTPVRSIDDVLAESGQCLAVPARPDSTIGGALAVGHSGLRQLGWGPVRDTVLEVRAVGADGKAFTAGGPTVKNVSGFDLCRLLVGSLGTLALMGEVLLRTRPLPPHEAWYATDDPPAVASDRLYRPLSLLWDGATTYALLAGHVDDVAAEATRAGLEPVDGPPAFPAHRCRLGWAEVEQWSRDGCDVVGLWGVGVAYVDRPAPARAVDDGVRALTLAIKDRFDPDRRLAPGRDVLA